MRRVLFLGRIVYSAGFFTISTTGTGAVYSLLTSAAKSSIVRAQLTDIRALAKLAEKLLVRGATSLRGVLTSPESVLRFAKYVDTHGDDGIHLAERVGRWVGVRVDGFRDSQALLDHYRLHFLDTGAPWLGRAFRDAGEYLDAARSVITNPSAKKVMYYHGGNPRLPRLGYIMERRGGVFLAAVDESGHLVTFHNLSQG